MPAESKTCLKCGHEKPLAAFTNNKAGKHGKRARCIECEREANRRRNKKYRETHGSVLTERQRTWAQENCRDRHLTRDQEKMMTYRRKWEELNKDSATRMKIDYQRRAVENLSPSYIATALKMPVAKVPQELLDLKRQHLIYHRLARQLKKGLKNETSKNNA